MILGQACAHRLPRVDRRPFPLCWSVLSTPQDELMLEYIELAKQSPPHSRGRTSIPCLRGHMFKSLFTAMAARTDLRARLTKARTLEDMVRQPGRGSQHTATDLGTDGRSSSEGPA